MLQFQKPQTCHAAAVCSGRKSENNCMKTRDGSLKEARTVNAASRATLWTHTPLQLSSSSSSSCGQLNEFNWKMARRSWSCCDWIRKLPRGVQLASPANQVIPFVHTQPDTKYSWHVAHVNYYWIINNQFKCNAKWAIKVQRRIYALYMVVWKDINVD